MKTFKTINGDSHNIDNSGNHFINNKCANPKYQSGKAIGSTYPPEKDRLNERTFRFKN